MTVLWVEIYWKAAFWVLLLATKSRMECIFMSCSWVSSIKNKWYYWTEDCLFLKGAITEAFHWEVQHHAVYSADWVSFYVTSIRWVIIPALDLYAVQKIWNGHNEYWLFMQERWKLIYNIILFSFCTTVQGFMHQFSYLFH